MKAFKLDLEAGRTANTYLLIGVPQGNAKWLVEQMLSLLFCKTEEAWPCGKCSGCSKVLRRMHPDIMWVEPKKKSRTIQRDQVLDARRHAYLSPYEGDWRSVVLIDAERLNDIASNTLLKTLEESPRSTLFFLLSDNPELLLPTVISRCRRIIVSEREACFGACDGFADGSQSDNMANSASSHDALRLAVADIMANEIVADSRVISGIIRAKMFLDYLKNIRKEFEAEEKNSSKQAHEDQGAREEIKDILAGRIEAKYVAARDFMLCSLLNWFRDMLLAVCDVDEKAFYFKEYAEYIRQMSVKLTRRQALDNIWVIEDMKRQLDQYVGETMVFERSMMKLCIN